MQGTSFEALNLEPLADISPEEHEQALASSSLSGDLPENAEQPFAEVPSSLQMCNPC